MQAGIQDVRDAQVLSMHERHCTPKAGFQTALGLIDGCGVVSTHTHTHTLNLTGQYLAISTPLL